MSKKSLTETDICMKYITPSLEKAGWDIHTQISREHYFTDGRIQVQGKLTAHWRKTNPNVEPASELLKRIQAEKQKLIAEKTIKKEKPSPSIGEDEKPYGLPEGWVWCRFGNLISFLNGFALKALPT